jgi:hypothetical protein
MNLKDLNLQELSVEEQVNVEGGFFPFLGLAIAALLCLIVDAFGGSITFEGNRLN